MNGGDASVEEFCAQLNSIKVDYERTSAEHENATKKKQYLQNDVESIKLRIQQLIPEVQELSLQFATLSQDEEEWNWKISMQEKEIQAQNELTNSLNEELQSLQNTFITQRNVAMEEIRSFKQEHEMLKQKKKTMMAQEGPLRADIEQTERLISNAQLERSQTEHELHVSQQECKKEELKKQQVLATYKELLEKQEQTRTIMEQEHEVLAQLRAQDQELDKQLQNLLNEKKKIGDTIVEERGMNATLTITVKRLNEQIALCNDALGHKQQPSPQQSPKKTLKLIGRQTRPPPQPKPEPPNAFSLIDDEIDEDMLPSIELRAPPETFVSATDYMRNDKKQPSLREQRLKNAVRKQLNKS